MLGDALWYARQLGATHLVDVATLTGACVVALGKTTSGLFGTPATWVEQVQAASERAGDRSWPMPVFEDYMEQLKSEIADFTNTGGRAGGAITGALFIKEFAGGLPWVHMDIAGTAWAEEAKPYQPKGATGVAVRTLVELALAAGVLVNQPLDVVKSDTAMWLQQNPIVVGPRRPAAARARHQHRHGAGHLRAGRGVSGRRGDRLRARGRRHAALQAPAGRVERRRWAPTHTQLGL